MEAPTSCPKCKNESIEAYVYSDTVDFRNLELDVENLERYRCLSCGVRWETAAQLGRNQARIKEEYAHARDRLRKRYGLLTAEKIAEIRRHLTINQKEASALFGGGANAFNKYESGEVLQSFAMDRLIRLTGVVGKRAVEFLKDVDAPHALAPTKEVAHTYFVVHLRTDYNHVSHPVELKAPKLMHYAEKQVRLPGTNPDIDSLYFDSSSSSMGSNSFGNQPTAYEYDTV